MNAPIPEQDDARSEKETKLNPEKANLPKKVATYKTDHDIYSDMQKKVNEG